MLGTRRAGTNEGDFNSQHFAFFGALNKAYWKIYLGTFNNVSCNAEDGLVDMKFVGQSFVTGAVLKRLFQT